MGYKKLRPTRTSLEVNTSYVGERIEEKIERILNNKEPISDGAPLVYTERKAGVLPETDIRTDRFDKALDAMDVVARSKKAQREKGGLKGIKGGKDEGSETKNDGGAEPIQGTETK